MSRMSEQMKQLKKQKEEDKSITKLPITERIEEYKEKYRDILGSTVSLDRFITLATSAIKRNRKLITCDPLTIFGALVEAARFQLEINSPLGQAFIIPYEMSEKINGKWTTRMVAAFQLGYQGAIEIFMRHPQAKSVRAHIVYENDYFEYELGLVPLLRHIPNTEDNPGKPVKYYSIAELKNGGIGISVMSKDQVIEHAKQHSLSYDKSKGEFKSAWKNDFDSMALKTVINKALKYLPKKIETYTDDEVIRSVDPEEIGTPGFQIPLVNNEIYGEIDDQSEEPGTKEEVSQNKSVPIQTKNLSGERRAKREVEYDIPEAYKNKQQDIDL